MYQITVERHGSDLTNRFSTDHYELYGREVALIRRGCETNYVPLYEFDKVYIMNEAGKTIDSYLAPEEIEIKE